MAPRQPGTYLVCISSNLRPAVTQYYACRSRSGTLGGRVFYFLLTKQAAVTNRDAMDLLVRAVTPTPGIQYCSCRSSESMPRRIDCACFACQPAMIKDLSGHRRKTMRHRARGDLIPLAENISTMWDLVHVFQACTSSWREYGTCCGTSRYLLPLDRKTARASRSKQGMSVKIHMFG